MFVSYKIYKNACVFSLLHPLHPLGTFLMRSLCLILYCTVCFSLFGRHHLVTSWLYQYAAFVSYQTYINVWNYKWTGKPFKKWRFKFLTLNLQVKCKQMIAQNWWELNQTTFIYEKYLIIQCSTIWKILNDTVW